MIYLAELKSRSSQTSAWIVASCCCICCCCYITKGYGFLSYWIFRNRKDKIDTISKLATFFFGAISRVLEGFFRAIFCDFLRVWAF